MVTLTDETLGDLLEKSLQAWASFAPKSPNHRGDHAPLRVAIGLLEAWGDRPLPPLSELVQAQVDEALRASWTLGSEEEALSERLAELLFRSGQAWEGKPGASRAGKLLVRSMLTGNGPVVRALLASANAPADVGKQCMFQVEASYAKRFPWLRRGPDGTESRRSALVSLPGLALLAMDASWKNHFVATLGASLVKKVDWQAPATSNGHRLLALATSAPASRQAWADLDSWRQNPTAAADLGAAVTRLHPFGVVPWVAGIPTDRQIPLELFDVLVASVVKVCGSAVRVHEQEACLKGLKNLFACQVRWPDGRPVTVDNWRSSQGVPLLPLLAKELLDPTLGFREVPSAISDQSPIASATARDLLGCDRPEQGTGHTLEGMPVEAWLEAWEMGSQLQVSVRPASWKHPEKAWGLVVKHPLLSHAMSNAVKRWYDQPGFPDIPLPAACRLAERMLDQPASSVVMGLRLQCKKLLPVWLEALGEPSLAGQRTAVVAWTALLDPAQAAPCWGGLSQEEKSQAAAWLTDHAQSVAHLSSTGAIGVKALALDLSLASPAPSVSRSPRL